MLITIDVKEGDLRLIKDSKRRKISPIIIKQVKRHLNI